MNYDNFATRKSFYNIPYRKLSPTEKNIPKQEKNIF